MAGYKARGVRDNNAAESAIRPVALGRKNWLVADAPKGASPMLFSLVEAAKATRSSPEPT